MFSGFDKVMAPFLISVGIGGKFGGGGGGAVDHDRCVIKDEISFSVKIINYYESPPLPKLEEIKRSQTLC